MEKRMPTLNEFINELAPPSKDILRSLRPQDYEPGGRYYKEPKLIDGVPAEWKKEYKRTLNDRHFQISFDSVSDKARNTWKIKDGHLKK